MILIFKAKFKSIGGHFSILIRSVFVEVSALCVRLPIVWMEPNTEEAGFAQLKKCNLSWKESTV